MPVGLDFFKDYIGVSGSSDDVQLQQFLDAAWATFTNEIGRDLDQRTYPAASDYARGDSGYYSGSGSRAIFLKNRPVIADGLTVYLDNSGRFGQNPDGAFASATLLTYGRDYVLRMDGCLPGTTTPCSYSGMIERVGTVWPMRSQYTPGQLLLQPIEGLGNIKVSYIAGFPTLPMDVRSAVCQLAAYIRRSADKGVPVNSESLGGYSYAVGQQAASGAVPELGGVRSTLLRYKGVHI